MSYQSLGDLSSTPFSGVAPQKPRSLFYKLTGYSSGELKAPLGMTSKGTVFIQGVLALVPPGTPPHKVLIFKTDLETSWKNRTMRIRGDAMSSFLEVPQIRRLILNEIQKILIPGKQPNANLITGEQDGPILELMFLEYYFNELLSFIPQSFRQVTKNMMYQMWPTREKQERTPDDLLRLLNTKCIQEILKSQTDVLFSAEKRNEAYLKQEGYTGQVLLEKRRELIEANVGYFAHTFVNGVDAIFYKEYYFDKDGNIIGTKHHRERNTTGARCGVPYYPDGTDDPAVPPPPNAVDFTGDQSPLPFAPLPPGQTSYESDAENTSSAKSASEGNTGGKRRRKTRRKNRKSKKTKSRKFHR